MAFSFLKGWFLNEELDVNPSFCAVQSPRSLKLNYGTQYMCSEVPGVFLLVTLGFKMESFVPAVSLLSSEAQQFWII